MAAKAAPAKEEPLSKSIIFGTSGLGGVLGWICVHPFNTLAVRMNLSSMQGGAPKGFDKRRAAPVSARDSNEPRSGLASPLHTANLSRLVLGCIEADFCKPIILISVSQHL